MLAPRRCGSLHLALEARRLLAFQSNLQTRCRVGKLGGGHPSSEFHKTIGDLLMTLGLTDDVGMAVEACPSGFTVALVVRHGSRSIGQSPPFGLRPHL